MAIEFRCEQCGKLLRTGDETAGKRAKCPTCGTIANVPAATTEPASSGPPTLPPDAGSPFGGGAPASQPAASGAENPYAAPGDFDPAASRQPVSHGPLGHTILDFSDVFAHQWAIFKIQWPMCLAGWLVVAVINFFASNILNYGGLFLGNTLGGEGLGFVLSMLGTVLGMLFNLWLFIGQTIFFLKLARGQEASIGDIFTGGPYYMTMLGAGFLAVIMFYFGLFLLIVPGIIIGLMLSQFYFLIIDRNAGVIDSLGRSRELMVGNKLTLFLIYLVSGVLGVLLVICTCFVGILAVGPYLSLLPAVIYLRMTGQPIASAAATGYPNA